MPGVPRKGIPNSLWKLRHGKGAYKGYLGPIYGPDSSGSPIVQTQQGLLQVSQLDEPNSSSSIMASYTLYIDVVTVVWHWLAVEQRLLKMY